MILVFFPYKSAKLYHYNVTHGEKPKERNKHKHEYEMNYQ